MKNKPNKMRPQDKPQTKLRIANRREKLVKIFAKGATVTKAQKELAKEGIVVSRATVGQVPVAEACGERSPHASATGALFPADLKALGRYHLPVAFKASGSEFRGWHGLRRMLASTLFSEGTSDLVVQRVLRHSRVIVTQRIVHPAL